MKRRLSYLLVTMVVVAAACKSKPTYPANHVAGDLKKMISRDYGMTNIETRRAGNTLQASYWRVGLLKPGQLEMQQDAAESLERVLLCATRISLSTDAPLQFLQVKLADALTGATVTLWRFVPDIRDSMYTRVSEEEYINRLVIEFNPDQEPKKDWKEHTWDPPITMGEFIGKQVVLRAKRNSPVTLQAHEDLSKPATLTVVVENWDSIVKDRSHPQDKVSDLVEATARQVVKGYRYKGFREFVLKNQRGMAVKTWAL